MLMLAKTGRNKHRRGGQCAAPSDLDGRRSVVKKHEQLCEMLPKTFIGPLWVQDHKSKRFRRPALLLVGERGRLDGVDYDDGTKARRGKTLARFNVSLVVTDRSYIYRRTERSFVATMHMQHAFTLARARQGKASVSVVFSLSPHTNHLVKWRDFRI